MVDDPEFFPRMPFADIPVTTARAQMVASDEALLIFWDVVAGRAAAIGRRGLVPRRGHGCGCSGRAPVEASGCAPAAAGMVARIGSVIVQRRPSSLNSRLVVPSSS